jgi:hypothetical protein
MTSRNISSDGTKGLLDARDLAMLDVFMQLCNYDFIAVDGGTNVRGGIPDYQLPPKGSAQQHAEKLLDVYRWVRARTDKPFVWVETYFEGMVGSTLVKEHADSWTYVLDEAAKIGGESVWYAWGAQQHMPDLNTLQVLSQRK